MPRSRRAPIPSVSLLLVSLLAASSPLAAQSSKPALDHDAYDVWRAVQGERISPDGAWIGFAYTLRLGDSELHVMRVDGGAEHVVPRGTGLRFTDDSRWAVFTIEPATDSVRAARLAEARPADLPKDTLGILDLQSGAITKVARVRSFRLPDEASGWVAYVLEDEPEGDAESEEESEEPGAEPTREPEVEPEPQVEEEEEIDESPDHDKPTGHRLVVRRLDPGMAEAGDEGLPPGAGLFEDVSSYAFAPDAGHLFFLTASEEGDHDGAWAVELDALGTDETPEARPLLEGEGSYTALAVAEVGTQVAFLTNRDDWTAEEHPAFALYHWREGGDDARRAVHEGADGLPSGWWVSEHGDVEFSESGARLFFGTAPRPEPEPEEEELLSEEEVVLDVWHWQDPLLQPMQKLQADDERERSYRAVVHLDDGGRVTQLEREDMLEVDVPDGGDAAVGVGRADVAYRHLVGIDSPGWTDYYLVDVATGERTRFLEEIQAFAQPSPSGAYVAWWDYGKRHYFAMPTRGGAGGEVVNLTAALPHPVWDELDDHPMPKSPYGFGGWTEGDEALLIYDRFDVWAVDPSGERSPRSITEGAGRADSLRLRVIDLDPDVDAIDPDAPLLLSAFDVVDKDAGFYRDRVQGDARPERLVLEAKRFGRPAKADDADRLLYTRQDVSEYPDLWVADLSFGGATKLSEANPQQGDYNWATVELVEWESADGIPLQGLLYRPEDFDPSKTYPMMVNFYERDSDNLHGHQPPLPHRSVVRPTFYASRGYVVFMPDVVYHDGYPGESAMSSIMPGVLKIAAEPWVDEDNVGIQGHSWGGYQIAYMVTQTDFFKAAEAGAPVANMTSAYGGIRWGSGMSRMFQYERTQSRIGEPLWDNRMRYIENSPLFFLDQVNTPLLIMHNDEDQAVPWEQGIELFVGLRRLGKPAWMIVYNGEPHWPVSEAEKKDWNVRMQQFFDHHLKGAPAPEWLTEGIPATEKGRTLGLDPAGGG
jgi:dipeptidyl aminopeptidase/acylaminoacyl peptidase